MSDAKVTSKGQITVPKAVRERLNVGPGDYLVFREDANGTIVVEAATTDLMALAGSVPSKAHGVTIDAMHDAVRQGASARARGAAAAAKHK